MRLPSLGWGAVGLLSVSLNATERCCTWLSKRGAISLKARHNNSREVLNRADDASMSGGDLRAQQLQPDPFVDTSSSPRVDLVHVAEQDEWCVTVNGERVLSFSGPSAWTKALSHRAELHDLLARDPSDKRGDVER